jgi:hypothetical protein
MIRSFTQRANIALISIEFVNMPELPSPLEHGEIDSS